MRKILLILLSCIAASCLLLSACTVVTPNTSSEEEQGLIFNEGYLDVIELGEPISAKQIIRIRELGILEPNVCKKFKINSIEELSYQQAEFVINTKEKALEKEKKGE